MILIRFVTILTTAHTLLFQNITLRCFPRGITFINRTFFNFQLHSNANVLFLSLQGRLQYLPVTSVLWFCQLYSRKQFSHHIPCPKPLSLNQYMPRVKLFELRVFQFNKNKGNHRVTVLVVLTQGADSKFVWHLYYTEEEETLLCRSSLMAGALEGLYKGGGVFVV